METGGIYTDEDGFVNIIVEQNESNFYICNFYYQNLTNNNICKYLNDLFKTSNYIIKSHYFIQNKCSNAIEVYHIDGYFGQVEEELLRKLQHQLHKCSWYFN